MDSAKHMSFDGPRLLQEQADVLSHSSAAEINYLHFLKLKLSAQQKATAQRNQLLRHGTAPRQGEAVYGEHGGASHPSSHFPGTYDSGAFAHNRSVDGGAAPRNDVSSNPYRPLEVSAPLRSSSREAREDAVPAAPPGQGSRRANTLDDVPASVVKRRSLGESQPIGGATANPYDEVLASPLASGGGDGLVGVPEQPTETVQLEGCPHCGRTFAPGRLEKHIDTCRRQQEREKEAQLRKPATNRTAAHRSSVADSVVSTTTTGNSIDSRKGSGILPQADAGAVQARRRPLTAAKAAPPAHSPKEY